VSQKVVAEDDDELSIYDDTNVSNIAASSEHSKLQSPVVTLYRKELPERGDRLTSPVNHDQTLALKLSHQESM
jgi:hypothetical protein